MRKHRPVIADLIRNPEGWRRAAVILASRQYPQGGVPFVRIRIHIIADLVRNPDGKRQRHAE